MGESLHPRAEVRRGVVAQIVRQVALDGVADPDGGGDERLAPGAEPQHRGAPVGRRGPPLDQRPPLELSLSTNDEALEAIVRLPVGGRGVIGDGEPFTPPWAA